MVGDGITWFTDFMGLGYRYYDVKPGVLLIFDKSNSIHNVWHRVIKWWPDDEIRMRFVETDDSYEFVLYGESRILKGNWVFVKTLNVSEHYRKFKEGYEGEARLGLALYKPKEDSYELSIYKYNKSVADVRFLKEFEAEQDKIVLRSRKILHGAG